MRKLITLTLSMLFFMLISGCNNHKVQTFDYYQLHLDTAQLVVNKCTDLKTIDSKEVLQDCKNAIDALTWSSLKNSSISTSDEIIPKANSALPRIKVDVKRELKHDFFVDLANVLISEKHDKNIKQNPKQLAVDFVELAGATLLAQHTHDTKTIFESTMIMINDTL